MLRVPADTSTEKDLCWWLYTLEDELGRRIILDHILIMEV